MPIEPECPEMNNFDKFTLQKNGFNKKIIQGMLCMLHILSEKNRLQEGGPAPRSLILDTSAKKSSFFYALPKGKN